ncbi:uncharacterized protein BJ212DRAFT_1403591 [Suillus subaureus]|uniref:Uncharacterized protein n=1 Tax=Suillus subaureus TaxID=48587 RepID=A0A9P7DMD5_9AGAM|nr:uncharacterized protein BJ212DRAFT_1403591 [Suillus subaureus]KAG1798384.1 hypothetical protein BJ212DRAFT_1403591 [Suillus subaureus]
MAYTRHITIPLVFWCNAALHHVQKYIEYPGIEIDNAHVSSYAGEVEFMTHLTCMHHNGCNGLERLHCSAPFDCSHNCSQ